MYSLFQFRRLFIFSVAILTLLAFSGCEKEGATEKAGKKIDRALDSVSDKLKDLKKD